MIVGVPQEIKNHEYRVALTPAGVHELTSNGHDVLVERGAGLGSSIADEDYAGAGARIVGSPDEVWRSAELVVKVKEPIAQEYPRMQPGQALFTYLHLAASAACTQALLDQKVTAIAYETVQREDGSLPLLVPMSEVAGRLAPLVGSHCLTRPQGGRGVLLGGVSGVKPARVVVLGAGVSGMNATAVAVGAWADVVLLDTNVDKLRAADRMYEGRVRTRAATTMAVAEEVEQADLVIGAVLVPGAQAPRLVTHEMVSRMRPGAVLVDIAIDQGGCFEDSRPTTHADPTYAVHDTVFYCVANMPGAVPHTSTHALANVTLPYALRLADGGVTQALRDDPALCGGLSTVGGQLTHRPTGEAHGLSSISPQEGLQLL